MDENLSRKSSESSLTTSGEYEIVNEGVVLTPPNAHHQSMSMTMMLVNPDDEVQPTLGNKSPTLAIANNRGIADLQFEMTDALRELEVNDETYSTSAKDKSSVLSIPGTSSPALIVPQERSSSTELCKRPIMFEESSAGAATVDLNRVGHSVFYDCVDATNAMAANNLEEKQDAMKPEKTDTDEEVSDIDQGCTIFSGVTYLGATNINAPKSEIDVYRIMSELNSCTTASGLKITISIPNSSEGLVVLHDAESNTMISTYEIQSIILYFRGPVDTVEHGCFAFTWLHGESLYQCHVFRCHIPEAVNQVSACFQKAFQTYAPSMTCSLTSAVDSYMMNSITSDLSGNPLNMASYEFIVALEIKERVSKNNYSAVPRDRNCFKLRAHTDKEIVITVQQTPSTVLQPLLIERCFGVLISPGKLVRQADMHLIDLVSMGYQQQQPTKVATVTTSNASASAGSGAGASGSGTANSNSENTSATSTLCLNPYCIIAEWKSIDKANELLNIETAKTYLTVAVNIVIRGIREPVRFVIETAVSIQSPGDLRIKDLFLSKHPMRMRFYLHLKRTTDEFTWEVSSIDPSEEIVEHPAQTSSSSSYFKFGIPNISRMVRSSSIVSIEDDCPTDYSSDGDEPLLSGTGEVSKDCSKDILIEWDPILKEWDGEKRPKNLSTLVRAGVPEALREKIWQKLANVEGKTEMTNMYKTLITMETKCETIIQRDIHRTFPAHKCFKENGGSGQDSLFKVSKAYAVYDTEVGYCQGLSFIAASLLLHMPEEDAFCVLVALMYDYGLRDLYKQGFETLYMRLYQLDRLIKDHLPKLHEHFTACGIETHMYASQWFLTLFTARFPLYFVFHVLDVFLLDGVPLLFQVAITLLSICEADLRMLDFEGVLKYFRVTLPKKCRSSSQARRVMKAACERKIKKLKHYEEEFMLQKQNKDRLEKDTQAYELRFGQERRKLQNEIDVLILQLSEANKRQEERDKKHTNIIQDYKQIIQRLEQDMNTMQENLSDVMSIVDKCAKCSAQLECKKGVNSKSVAGNGNNESKSQKEVDERHVLTKLSTIGPLDPLNVATQRIRELELELAQAKLAQVEAECRSQDLNHQLSTAMTEMNANRNSWQPWLSKTFNSLQEKVTTRVNRDTPTFQSYTSQISANETTTNAQNSNQENPEQAGLNVSPKLQGKFQTTKIRNSIDSLRNMVVPLDVTKIAMVADNRAAN